MLGELLLIFGPRQRRSREIPSSSTTWISASLLLVLNSLHAVSSPHSRTGLRTLWPRLEYGLIINGHSLRHLAIPEKQPDTTAHSLVMEELSTPSGNSMSGIS